MHTLWGVCLKSVISCTPMMWHTKWQARSHLAYFLWCKWVASPGSEAVRDLCFVDGCGIIGPKFHHQRAMIPPGSSCTQFHVNSCLQWVRLIYPHIQSQFQKTVSQNKSVQPQALAAQRRLWYALARLWLTKKGFGKALVDEQASAQAELVWALHTASAWSLQPVVVPNPINPGWPWWHLERWWDRWKMCSKTLGAYRWNHQ